MADDKQVLVASKNMPIAEMIGRTARPFVASPFFTTTTVDWTRVDYAFWDQLRRGKKEDYDLGGLFAKPIGRTLAHWSLGKGITPEVDETEDSTGDTETALQDFVADNLVTLIETAEDSLELGDSYLVVNPDGTLTRASADVVEVLADPPGSQNVVGYRITAKLEKQTIIDEYRLTGRTVTVEAEGQKVVTTYPNLIGLLPVIHWPTERSANEVYGHPYFEQLLRLFGRYNRTLSKALDGTEAMGNPLPVVEGAENPDQVLKLLSGGRTHTYIDEDNKEQTVPVVDWSQIPVAVLGKGAAFKFAGPNSFTGDTSKMLEILFLLMLQATGIPEWVWGGAIASSKASVDAQYPAFENLIDGLRLKLKGPLLTTMRVYLATIALYAPNIEAQAEIALKFGSVVAEDRAQKLEEIKFARGEGGTTTLITEETALRLLNLVEDPAAEVEAARKETQMNQQAQQDGVDQALMKLLDNPSPDGAGDGQAEAGQGAKAA
jgi:Phage portal protein, SPP1 Gp6-like